MCVIHTLLAGVGVLTDKTVARTGAYKSLTRLSCPAGLTLTVPMVVFVGVFHTDRAAIWG
jgi:hypothetical protein